MITVRKLAGLPEGTRLRKILRLVQDWERNLAAGVPGDPGYQGAVLGLLGDGLPPAGPLPLGQRDLHRLKIDLTGRLGLSPADWDLTSPPDPIHPGPGFPLIPYLEELRSPFNIGSILRTSAAFGINEVLVSPGGPDLGQPRLRKSSMGTWEALSVVEVPLDHLEAWASGRQLVIFALELGGLPARDFPFPAAGICLVGSEELGLSPEALALADRHGGRVSLPLYGAKASLNVGVSWGILAAAWTERLGLGRA